MPDQIDHQDQKGGNPDIVHQGTAVVENPQCVIHKQPSLKNEDGVTHHKQDLPHGIALITMMKGTVIFVGDDPPQITNKTSFDINDEDQEQQAEQEEEKLKSSGGRLL